MRIAVRGLWHLGLVVAAGIAGRGHDVIALDEPERVRALRAGGFPVLEPGHRRAAAFRADPRVEHVTIGVPG